MKRKKKIYIFQQVRKYVKRINFEEKKETDKQLCVRRRIKKGIIFIVVIHLLGILFNHLLFKSEFLDDDENRGAISETAGLFNENNAVPSYLDQGWFEKDSLWFYRISQGSNILPYDFYMVLEQAESNDLFRSIANTRKYQYLIRKKTKSNPDALPVGFSKDSYQDKEYLGFTCAACHTSQINYTDNKTGENKAIRIDGGPAQSDLESFMEDLSSALKVTLNNEKKRQNFVNCVLDRNGFKKILTGGRNYSNEQQVLDDLKTVSRRIDTYNQINKSEHRYGYSRLDAFGRIYNRILEHLVDEKTLETVFTNYLSESEAKNLVEKVIKESGSKIHLVDSTLDFLKAHSNNSNSNKEEDKESEEQLFLNSLFTAANAPVSYPYLWDIPFHDYLQWNGIVSNAGGGALGRNVGQVIGVFGTLDWQKNDNFSPSNYLIENKSVLDRVSFHSSIDMRNISRVETLLKKLKSPKWPEQKLGLINYEKSSRGRKIFTQYCLDCHGHIDRDDPQRRITAHFSSIENVGTDPKMATNSISKVGYTGILQGSYVDVPVGKILLQEKAPVALMVAATTENTIKTPDMDTNIFVRWSDWIYDMFFVLFKNPVEETVKKGNYTADSTVEPFASLLSYKARPLNGIWATGPYLHNGSVPTLYDLLLPQAQRPKEFMVGSRVFDKEKVGFKAKDYDGFVFDTTKEGNHNTGHEYAAGKTALPNGEKLPALNDVQRDDLLEYLKTL